MSRIQFGMPKKIKKKSPKKILPTDLFEIWLSELGHSCAEIRVFGEKKGTRQKALRAIKEKVIEHFVGLETVLTLGGYKKSAQVIRDSLPANKKTRSGDLGELLASEFVDSRTEFRVPLKKLKMKSDKEMAMHGNDVIAIDFSVRPVRILKLESKSRAAFTPSVFEEALSSLSLHDSRPNPSTVAFVIRQLASSGKAKEAQAIRNLLVNKAIPLANITHMVFVLSGNDPFVHLSKPGTPRRRGVKSIHAAIVIADHQEFIKTVFEAHNG